MNPLTALGRLLFRSKAKKTKLAANAAIEPKVAAQSKPDEPPQVPDVAKRAEFELRQSELDKAFAAAKAEVETIATPPAIVAAALQKAADAQTAANNAAAAKVEDWPKATIALDEFERLTAAIGPECVRQAQIESEQFTTTFNTGKNKPAAGAAQIKARIAYLGEQKKLNGLITGGQGAAALKAAPGVQVALDAFMALTAPSTADKAKTTAAAIKAMKELSEEELTAKTTTQLAELAFDLCAAGPPKSGDALTQLCRVYRGTKPAPEFLAQREEERGKIVAAVADLPEVSKLFGASGKVDVKAWAKVVADEAQVKALLKLVSDKQAEILGLPPIEVTTYSKPSSNGTTSMGGCVWTDGPATINMNAHKDAVGNPKEALISILHETYHAQQDELVKRLMRGDLDPSDPIYPQVLMYAVNKPGIGYLPPSVNQQEYEAQPVEVDAENQGNATATALFLAIAKAKKPVVVKAKTEETV